MKQNITLKSIYQKIESALRANLAEEIGHSVTLLKEILADLDA